MAYPQRQRRKPRIDGIPDHPNRDESNIAFLLNYERTGVKVHNKDYPSQRGYTKDIPEYPLSIYWKLMEIKKSLNFSIKHLLNLCIELDCNISDYTLTRFLSKWGPAFPPNIITVRSLLRLLSELETIYKSKHGKKFEFSVK